MRALGVLAVGLWCCVVGSPLFAQGSAEDYARAQRLARDVRGKVLNLAIDPFWLSETELVFRHQLAPRRWEFLRVDGSRGTRERAFDHDAVAEKLGELQRDRSFQGDRLPIDGCDLLDNGDLQVHVGASTVVVSESGELTLREGGAARAGLPAVRGRRSWNGSGDTEIVFVNRTDDEVEIEWVDADGALRSYGVVRPGEERRQHTYAGHLWRVSRAGVELGRYRAIPRRDGASRRPVIIDGTPHTPAPEVNASPRRDRLQSPDGTWRIEVREHDLWLRRIEDGEEFLLDESGEPEDRYVRTVYWSPDSERVIVLRERPAQAHPVSFVESSPRDQVQPRLHTFDYLKPGDRIAERRPRLFDVSERREIPIDDSRFPNPWSLTHARWLTNGEEFVFLHNERGHQRLAVLAIHRDDGSVRTIVENRSDTFVDYSQKRYLEWSPDDRTLIWMSERSGYNHLYRVDVATGAVTHPITQGEWVVRGVDRVDFDAGKIWFRAMGMDADQDPYHVHHARASLDGTELVRLTRGDGTHDLDWSPEGTTYIDRYSRVDLPPIHELRRAKDGELLAELARADASALDALGWRAPKRFSAKGRDDETDIWGLVVVPSNFDPTKRYPVLEQIYAGPHGHHVPKRFSAWIGARALAELGFVVGQIDGMGTNWRSKKFHDVCWRNLADAGFPDRIAWWRAFAAAHPYVDLERVGIYGGSAGGQNALRALIDHGEFYRAAVADCGCHDNRMDKIWWNEAWMGWPIGSHYAENSNVTHAHRVERPLMLIVGELDRNVDPASTMQVVDALIRADRDFDLIVMTGVGHGAAETPYGKRRRADFFVRHLMQRTPRWTP